MNCMLKLFLVVILIEYIMYKTSINTTIYFLSIITYKERMDECDPCSAGFVFCMHTLEINLWPSTPGSCDGGYKHNKSHSIVESCLFII